jgi:hypothetical protein
MWDNKLKKNKSGERTKPGITGIKSGKEKLGRRENSEKNSLLFLLNH